MSAFSSPSTLITINASSTPIQVLSALKIVAGLTAFIAPAFYSSNAFGRNGARVRSTAVGGASVGRVGLETEASLTTRLTGARDVALGLLLRDPTAAVVARALQVSVIADTLDVAAFIWGYLEGTLSSEVAGAGGLVAAISGAIQVFILNRA